MDEQYLLRILRQAAELVRRAVDEEITFPEFLREYSNFYHYNALDGHEAAETDRAMLQKHGRLCRLHEDVQTKVVDLTFSAPEEQRALYERAGRLDESKALARLKEVAAEHDLRALLVASAGS
jgi:hypothetical protein